MLPDDPAPEAEGGVFRALLRSRPGLEPFLRRLCEGINRREAMQGTIALGPSQARTDDFEPLVEVLGGRALSLSIRGEMRLSLDACFAGIPPGRREAWLDELFQAVGVPAWPGPASKKRPPARWKPCWNVSGSPTRISRPYTKA